MKLKSAFSSTATALIIAIVLFSALPTSADTGAAEDGPRYSWFAPADGSWFPPEDGGHWAYHSDHGWIAIVAPTETSFWYWEPRFQWFWTAENVYPFLYSVTRTSWVYYYEGTTSPRWFVDASNPELTYRDDKMILNLLFDRRGSVSADPEKGFYEEGEEVMLTASPRSGNAFLGWTGDAPNWKRPQLTITMDGDKSISAQFGANAATSHYNSVVNSTNVRLDPQGNPREDSWDYGEGFSWYAQYNSNLDRFVWNYLDSEETIWLDQGVRMYDWLVSRMEDYPDGYPGWIGEQVFDIPGARGSAVVGDANLILPMLNFAEVVLSDPELEPIYGVYANEYVELAKELVAKWEARESYQQWGQYAAYARQRHFVSETDGSWVIREDSGKTENQNKSGKFAIVQLRLYRITGEEQYRENAERVFNHYKRRFRYIESEDRYVWNFWEPFDGDDFTVSNTPDVTWMGVHPQASYQADEVSFFVEAYDTGVTFTEEDIQRMVNTNIWMRTGSGWRAADGSSGGMLWPSLLRFSQDLQDATGSSATISWDRVHEDVDEEDLPLIPIYNSQHFTSAAVFPASFDPENDESTRIWMRASGSGTLTISLLDENGDLITELHSQSVSSGADISFLWDGTDADENILPAGKYIVRLDIQTSRRDIEVEIL